MDVLSWRPFVLTSLLLDKPPGSSSLVLGVHSFVINSPANALLESAEKGELPYKYFEYQIFTKESSLRGVDHGVALFQVRAAPSSSRLKSNSRTREVTIPVMTKHKKIVCIAFDAF